MTSTSLRLPGRWQTIRLSASDSKEEDSGELQRIYDSCIYIHAWTGLGGSTPAGDEMLAALRGADLPPGGSTEAFRLQTIRLAAGGDAIGFLEMYHGYPEPDIFWLADLSVRRDCQGRGYGREIVAGLIGQVAALGCFTRIQLGVALKNWPAIRFWTAAGFDRIVRLKGDAVFADDAYAFLILEKPLQK